MVNTHYKSHITSSKIASHHSEAAVDFQARGCKMHHQSSRQLLDSFLFLPSHGIYQLLFFLVPLC